MPVSLWFEVVADYPAGVLHVISTTADLQTRRMHAAIGGPTRRIGPGGDDRHWPAAVASLWRGEERAVVAWGLSALSAAVVAGCRRVVFVPDRPLGTKRLRWVRSMYDRRPFDLIWPTATQARRAAAAGIPADRATVIRPAADFARIPCRPSPLRAELGLTDGDYVLLAPGESTVAAGHDMALWACGILQVLDPKHKLLLWGRGDRAKQLVDLARRFDQSSMIRVAPGVEFEDLTAAADAALVAAAGVVPTYPVIAAMAAGLPIVSTTTYTIGELLENNHTALLVTRRSPRELARRVLDLQADPALAATLGSNARAEAYEYFSTSKMREAFKNVIDGLPARPTDSALAGY